MSTPYPGPTAGTSQSTAAASPSGTATPAPKARARGGPGTGTKRPRKNKAKAGTPAPAGEAASAAQSPGPSSQWSDPGAVVAAAQIASALSSTSDTTGFVVLPSSTSGEASKTPGQPGQEEEAEGDDEALPAMAEDDYSAQLSWQSQSKDNLKVLMDNFTPEQYDRFEAYRRHALPKQAVRKVIQQGLGHQVSTPVAQIVAGFSKVFVGEIVEKAREVQERRGETGPLSPDHLREAYHLYQLDAGRVGAARPLKSKRLFRR